MSGVRFTSVGAFRRTVRLWSGGLQTAVAGVISLYLATLLELDEAGWSAFWWAIGVFTVGYTLLNRHTPEVNYSHWHIVDPGMRAAGLSTALYPHRIKLYFDMAPMTRLIHQTRVTNVGVNRMLDRYVPVAETRFIEKPDGVAAPGEFHLRYVVRADIPGFFEVFGK